MPEYNVVKYKLPIRKEEKKCLTTQITAHSKQLHPIPILPFSEIRWIFKHRQNEENKKRTRNNNRGRELYNFVPKWDSICFPITLCCSFLQLSHLLSARNRSFLPAKRNVNLNSIQLNCDTLSLKCLF